MYRVNPSPCEVISSDTTVREAIQLMQERNRTYVLIENNLHHLVGILTSSDLLKRFKVFTEPENWDRPVSIFMSQPVKYLNVDFIHTCSEFMTHHNIKHVPIVSREKKLMGVVTSDSILKALVHYNGLPPLFGTGTTKEVSRDLGVLSPDGSFYHTIDNLFANNAFVGVDRLMFGDLQQESVLKDTCRKYDALIMDLDDAPVNESIPLLRAFNADPNLEIVVLVYTRYKHKKEFLEVLEHLKVLGQFIVYGKPVDFVQLLNDLEGIWTRAKSEE